MYILRITFKSIKKINQLKKKLLKIKKIKNIQIKNVFNIKNKNKIFTILKSPHVNKKSREHFVYKNFNQKIDIKFSNFFELIDFFIITKKVLTENFNIQTKIIKKCL